MFSKKVKSKEEKTENRGGEESDGNATDHSRDGDDEATDQTDDDGPTRQDVASEPEDGGDEEGGTEAEEGLIHSNSDSEYSRIWANVERVDYDAVWMPDSGSEPSSEAEGESGSEEGDEDALKRKRRKKKRKGSEVSGSDVGSVPEVKATDAFEYFGVGEKGDEPVAPWHVMLLVSMHSCPKIIWKKIRHYLTETDTSSFIWGVILAQFWFIVMWLVYSLPTGLTVTLCSAVSFFLPLAMGLSTKFRTYVFLVIAGISGQYGRSLLLVCAYSMVMRGPMVNYANNLRVYQDSLECAKEQAHNASVQQLSRMTLPDEGVFGALKKLQENVKKMVENIRLMYDRLLDALRTMHEILEKIRNFLKKFQNLCMKITSIPYNLCCKFFVILESWICKHFKKMNYPCTWFRKLKNYIKKKIAKKMKEQFEKTKKKLWEMNMTVVHRMVLNKTITKPHDQIAREIKGEMMKYLAWIDRFNFWMDVLYFVLLVFAIMQATKYHKKYINIIEWDNFYITSVLKDLDEKRFNEGKETLLPLQKKEKRKYIKPGRIAPTGKEFKRMCGMFVTSTFIIVNVGIYLAADYFLFSCLDYVSELGNVKIVVPEAPKSKIGVSGKGGLASFYRELAGELNKFDISAAPPTFLNACMPKPFPPDYHVYKIIGAMCGCVYILVIIDVYLLRLRHAIMGHFYPEKAKVRGEWLYYHILRLRATFGKRNRRKVQKKKLMLIHKAQNALKTLFSLFPPLKALIKCFMADMLFCFACGFMFKASKTKTYKKCETLGCKGVYCNECFADLQNICVVCKMPIDYGDLSDVDEEKDSSGEEGLSIAQMRVALQAQFPTMFLPDETGSPSQWPRDLHDMGIPARL